MARSSVPAPGEVVMRRRGVMRLWIAMFPVVTSAVPVLALHPVPGVSPALQGRTSIEAPCSGRPSRGPDPGALPTVADRIGCAPLIQQSAPAAPPAAQAQGEPATGPDGSADKIGPPEEVTAQRSFALLALSRGQGVPEAGRAAVAEFRTLLRSMEADGEVVEIVEQRIGLEGEIKLCAEFASAESAERAWLQTQRSIAGIDLVHLEAEVCDR